MEKTIISIISFVVFAITFSSCMDKLEILPNDQIITDNFFEEGSPEEIESGVNSMYQRLQSSYLYNLRMWTLDIVAGEGRVGNEAGGNGLETVQLSNFTATSDNSGAKELWRGPWAGISRTNWILTNIDKSPKVSDEKKTQYKGEAHFLRGLYYFNLVRLFGDVPWIEKQQTASDDLQVSRTSKDIVYQHIIEDFSDAASMLPATYENTTDIGRATKGAAFGFLAKVYLTLKQYNECLIAIDSVTNLGVYSLNRKYEWNFDDLRENGPESLFEVQYEKDVTAYAEFDILGQGGWHHEYLAPLASINIGGPWGNFGWFAVFAGIGQVFEGWVGWMRTGGAYILAASLCNWMAVLLCCVFVMLIQRNVKRNRVFVASNERLLRSIGIAVIADGIAQYLLFVYYRSGEAFTDPGTIILLGIFFLFIACLFKVGIRMKEEQDLTI